MYSGYGSICKKQVHRPGSLLYYNLNSINDEKDMHIKKKVKEYTQIPLSKSNRFYPSPPESSLSYRYDSINETVPNNYKQENNTSDKYVSRYNTGQRKNGPQSCTSCKTPSVNGKEIDLYPILDPKFNLREVAKHMILLEDHLFQTGRRCDDCINKHRLTLEAFLEEAITLDVNNEYFEIINTTLTKFKELMKNFVEKVRKNPVKDINSVYCFTAQELRKLRKPLCMSFSDFC